METTVVNPTGTTPSIFSTGGGGHHGHHDGEGRRFDAVEARADFRALTNEIERFGTLNGDRTLTGVQVTGDRINTVGAAGALASGHTDQLVGAGFGGVHDRLCDAKAGIIGRIDTTATAAALAACKTSDEVAAVYAALQKQASDAATATVVGFKDAQATAYQIEGRTQLDAAKNTAVLGLQQTTGFNAASVEATKNFYATSLEAAKYANAATLQAQEIAAVAAAKAAECCCRLEMQAAANLAAITATVVAGNTAILGKFDQSTIDNLRAQLVATQRLIPVTIAVGA